MFSRLKNKYRNKKKGEVWSVKFHREILEPYII